MASETPALVETSDEGLIADLTPAPSPGVPGVMYDIAPAAIFKVLLTLAALWMIIHIFPVVLLISISLMLVATFSSHRYWEFSDVAARRIQESSFYKNMAILGGFGFLFVCSGGRLSLDGWLRRRD